MVIMHLLASLCTTIGWNRLYLSNGLTKIIIGSWKSSICIQCWVYLGCNITCVVLFSGIQKSFWRSSSMVNCYTYTSLLGVIMPISRLVKGVFPKSIPTLAYVSQASRCIYITACCMQIVMAIPKLTLTSLLLVLIIMLSAGIQRH